MITAPEAHVVADDAQPTQPVLSVLMPVYNEEKTLEQVVEAVRAVDLRKEIILVDDGSRDGSAAIIDCVWQIPFRLMPTFDDWG